MPSKRRHNNIPKHPLDRQFASIQEAAKAKTEHVLNTVFKNADRYSPKNR